MNLVRDMRYLLMAYGCPFVLAYLIPEQIDRREYAQAVVAYAQNPTQENEAGLRSERGANEHIHLRHSAVLGFVLVGIGYGIWSGRRLMTRLTHRTRPGNLQR